MNEKKLDNITEIKINEIFEQITKFDNSSIQQKLIDIIKTQKNVNYNIQDVYRQTCLYYAINSQNYLFIYNLKDKLLFDDISNKEGLTPIKYCIEKIENTLKQFDKSKNLAKDQKLYSYDHMGFWHAMDKLSDKIYLENLWNKNAAPWKIWAN